MKKKKGTLEQSKKDHKNTRVRRLGPAVAADTIRGTVWWNPSEWVKPAGAECATEPCLCCACCVNGLVCYIAQAFGVAKYGKAHRVVQRNLDRGHRKEHVPLAERTSTTAPPITVVVMGPKGVGKTTLIKVQCALPCPAPCRSLPARDDSAAPPRNRGSCT